MSVTQNIQEWATTPGTKPILSLGWCPGCFRKALRRTKERHEAEPITNASCRFDIQYLCAHFQTSLRGR